MIKQIGQAVTFFAQYLDAKIGKTGLTVTVNIYDVDYTSKLVNAAAATEIGDGVYCYTLPASSVTAAGNYLAVFKTATTTVQQRDIASMWSVGETWVERIDTAISTRAASSELAIIDNIVDGIAETLGVASVVVVNHSSAVSADGGTLYLVRGNSYQDSAGWIPPSWTISGADLPDFSGANIYLRLPGTGDVPMTIAALADGFTISGELSAKQTGSITGDYWELLAIWENGVMRILNGAISWQ